MSYRWFAALCAVLALSSTLGAEPRTPSHGSAFAKVRPVRLKLPTLKQGEITQFLAADRKGRLFLLRGDTLEVFRLRDAELESVGKLACRRSRDGAYAAAMDPSGSTWAVAGTAFDLALCDFREEKRPAGLSGFVSSVTFSGTGPLVAVAGGGSRPDVARPISAKVPRVFGLEGSRWKAVSWDSLPEISDRTIGVMTQIKAQTDSLVCASPKKNSIWLASWNAYRLREVSDSEKPKRELLVGSGKLTWAEWSPKEREALSANLKKQGVDTTKNRGGQVYAQNVIRANLCGRDGLIYLLVTTPEGFALDRFDPVVNTLERVLLDGVKSGEGPMTAVLGSDELLLGGRFTTDGLWRIALEDLASAAWMPVPGARVNGKPIS